LYLVQPQYVEVVAGVVVAHLEEEALVVVEDEYVGAEDVDGGADGHHRHEEVFLADAELDLVLALDVENPAEIVKLLNLRQ
jgi:hypothetical protein